MLESECAICLEQIYYPCTSLPCCHYFHSNCLYIWSIRDNSCPICRKRFNFKPKNGKDLEDWLFNKGQRSSYFEETQRFVEIIDTLVRCAENDIKCSKKIYALYLLTMKDNEDRLSCSFLQNMYYNFYKIEPIIKYGWFKKMIRKIEALVKETNV